MADPRVDTFLGEQKRDASHEHFLAVFDLTLAYILFWLAVLASIAAAIAGYFTDNKALISTLAAAPALVMLIEQTFGFEARSDWHWEKMHGLTNLAGQVRYQDLSVADAFDLKKKFLEGLEPRFPKLRAPFLRSGKSLLLIAGGDDIGSYVVATAPSYGGATSQVIISGWLASAPIGRSLPAWLGMSATTRRVRRLGYLRLAGADPGKKGLRQPACPLTIARVMECIKVSSTHRINAGRQERGILWQPRYFDRALRTVKEYREKVGYIHQNPVRAGLVGRAEDWLWSSAGEYSGTLRATVSPHPILRIDRVSLPADERARI